MRGVPSRQSRPPRPRGLARCTRPPTTPPPGADPTLPESRLRVSAVRNALIGILDVGKTHTKFIAADADSGRVAARTRAAISIHRGARDSRARCRRHRAMAPRNTLGVSRNKAAIEALVPVAHGAAAVLLDSGERVLFAPDYEDHAFELVAETYRTQRDPFSETFSPFLPFGLNIGRQLHFLESRHAAQFKRIQSCLLYPQYWAWRLCGEKASEVTSLGCQSRSVAPAGSQTLKARRPQRLEPPASCAQGGIGHVGSRVGRACGRDRIGPCLSRAVRHS